MEFDLTVWDIVAVCSKLLTFIGSFLATGSFLFILANPNLTPTLLRPLKKIILSGAIFAALFSLAQIGAQSGRLLDEGWGGVVDPEMLELVINGPLGQSVYVRVAGLALLLLFALSVPFQIYVGMAGAIVTAFSFSLVGHGSSDPRWLLSGLVILHLLGISFWIGALWPLRAGADGLLPLPQAAALAHRFGLQAMVVVSGLIAAGAILIILIVGSLQALFTSAYGLALLIKLTGVFGLLALASLNKLRFVPAMLSGDQDGANRLNRSILFEMIMIILILFVTAILTTITPLPEMHQ